jgi:hypothetical protein
VDDTTASGPTLPSGEATIEPAAGTAIGRFVLGCVAEDLHRLHREDEAIVARGHEDDEIDAWLAKHR